MKRTALKESAFLVYADGGSRGNHLGPAVGPGPAAIGAVIYQDSKKIKEISQFIGPATNNQAEYQAVLKVLGWFESQKLPGAVINFKLDSQLIVEQLNLRYKLKNPGLKPLFWQIRDKIMKNGLNCLFSAIPRSQNRQADKLVNQALDKQQG